MIEEIKYGVSLDFYSHNPRFSHVFGDNPLWKKHYAPISERISSRDFGEETCWRIEALNEEASVSEQLNDILRAFPAGYKYSRKDDVEVYLVIAMYWNTKILACSSVSLSAEDIAKLSEIIPTFDVSITQYPCAGEED